MRLRHPDLDDVFDAPDDPHTIAVHLNAGWVAEVPAAHETDLEAAADLARALIAEGDYDGADRVLMHAVHHGGLRPWEMFAAGGPIDTGPGKRTSNID